MKKFKLAIPVIVLLALPWTHRMLIENLLLAWPSTPIDSAHWIVGIASVLAAFASMIITADI